MTPGPYANEYPGLGGRDNERREYLGDAVLQLVTAEYLDKIRPSAHEGELTQNRSAMVNTNTLASLAADLELGDYLYLGKGVARTGGRGPKSPLASAVGATLVAFFPPAAFYAALPSLLRAPPDPPSPGNNTHRMCGTGAPPGQVFYPPHTFTRTLPT